MNKIIQIKVFNDILDQFFEYLQENFTFYRSDVILAKTTIGFLQRNNPRLVVEQFMEHIKPYTHHVFECDEQFFLNFKDSMLDDDFVQKNILTCLKITNIWTSSDIKNEQKAYIWLYLQKLIKAGEKVVL
jgi:hypothetical protein